MLYLQDVKVLPNSSPHSVFAPKLIELIQKKLAFDDAEALESNSFEVTC